MNYKVLRGNHQIGGSVVELESDSSVKIWVDFGSELSGEKGNVSDDEMIRLMKDDESRPDAVFFTHIHGDHAGLLPFVPDGVDIFIGPRAREMLLNIRETLLRVDALDEEERKLLAREVELLNSPRIHLYENKKADWYKGIQFIPLRVDHSIFDAYMLRFNLDGKSVVHTGDFRMHGRLGRTLIDDIKENLVDEKKPVDILFTEGTMMSRSKENVMTEHELKTEAAKLLKDNKYAFLICSSTNVDRLSSIYRAAVSKKNKRAFYCNSYVKRQLDLYTSEIGEAEGRWEYKFYRSYPFEWNLKKKFGGKTQFQHMIDEGFVMMVGTSQYYMDLMERFREYQPILIYSLWDGYLKPDEEYTRDDLIRVVDAWKSNVKILHTSGHATPSVLEKVIDTIHPAEKIIPIHTKNPQGFLGLHLLPELKNKIEIN